MNPLCATKCWISFRKGAESLLLFVLSSYGKSGDGKKCVGQRLCSWFLPAAQKRRPSAHTTSIDLLYASNRSTARHHNLYKCVTRGQLGQLLVASETSSGFPSVGSMLAIILGANPRACHSHRHTLSVRESRSKVVEADLTGQHRTA